MNKDTKSKAPKKNARTTSNERVLKHEKLIQDRILGLSVTELAKKYNLNRNSVGSICEKNKERIEQACAAIAADRQEAINKALSDENENLIRLYCKATLFLETSFDDAVEGVKLEKEKGEYSLEQRTETLHAAVKAFDRIKANMLAHQKLAMTPVENALPS